MMNVMEAEKGACAVMVSSAVPKCSGSKAHQPTVDHSPVTQIYHTKNYYCS